MSVSSAWKPRILEAVPSAYREPSIQLKPHVAALWCYRGEQLPQRRERILPGAHMQILVNLDEDRVRYWDGVELSREHHRRGVLVSGIYQSPFAIDTASQRNVMGAVLRPGAARSLLGVAAHRLASTHVDLDALWGRDAVLLRERLCEQHCADDALRVFDQVLCKQIAREPDPAIAYAVAQLEHRARVSDLADELGYSQKLLRKRFRDAVGVTPKSFARLTRLQCLLTAAARRSHESWSQLALDAGYYDQPHMISELKTLTGLTPSKYSPREEADHNHVILDG
jgi:AraC-like DNA-binding protein